MSESNDHFYEFDSFRLNSSQHILVRNGQIVPLTPKVFDTLLVLVQNQGRVVEKDRLLKEVWSDAFVEEANLAKNISILRKILGDSCIETIPKRGYRFIATVNEADVPDEIDELGKPDLVSSKKYRLALTSLLVLLIGLIGLSVWYSGINSNAPTIAKPIGSIVVLPLENLSGDETQEYFVDGLTDLLITELIKVGDLRVISRNSSMVYKGKRKTVSEIAQELKVDVVVQGTVLRSGDKVRISVQLFRAEGEQNLWAENYEHDLSDILSLQKEVSLGIVNSIKIQLTGPEQADLSRQSFSNAEAQEAYLKGLFYWHQGIASKGSLEEVKALYFKSFEFFQQAITLEPDNAQAYAGLAEAYQWLGSSGFPEYYTKSKEAALTAIRLDETNSQAHGALGWVLWRSEWKFAEAEREMKREVELDPNSSRGRYAMLLVSLGRIDEALSAVKIGEPLDPLNIAFKQVIAVIYLDARKYEIAETRFRELIETDPNDDFSRGLLADTLALQGRHEEAIAEYLKVDTRQKDDPATNLRLAWYYATAGRRNEATNILSGLTKSPDSASKPVRIAEVYCVLGEKEQAYHWLEKALAKRLQGILYIKTSPSFDSLRGEARFHDLLRRIGFPE